MVIAGEASGDMLAAELVRALRRETADAEAIPTADYQPLHTEPGAAVFRRRRATDGCCRSGPGL